MSSGDSVTASGTLTIVQGDAMFVRMDTMDWTQEIFLDAKVRFLITTQRIGLLQFNQLTSQSATQSVRQTINHS